MKRLLAKWAAEGGCSRIRLGFIFSKGGSVSPFLTVQALTLFESGIQPGPQFASEHLLLGSNGSHTWCVCTRGETAHISACRENNCSQSSEPLDSSCFFFFLIQGFSSQIHSWLKEEVFIVFKISWTLWSLLQNTEMCHSRSTYSLRDICPSTDLRLSFKPWHVIIVYLSREFPAALQM